MQAHLIPCVRTYSVNFVDNFLATVSTWFPTWHVSLHVLNIWLKIVKIELSGNYWPCQDLRCCQLSLKVNLMWPSLITLDICLCYSNINRTGNSIHSLLHQKTIWKRVCYWIMIVNAYMFSTTFTYLFPSNSIAIL